jgi:hypothetical protein
MMNAASLNASYLFYSVLFLDNKELKKLARTSFCDEICVEPVRSIILLVVVSLTRPDKLADFSRANADFSRSLASFAVTSSMLDVLEGDIRFGGVCFGDSTLIGSASGTAV